MQRLVATEDFPYAGKPLKSGDPFDASDEDARILKGVGRAKEPLPAESEAPVETRAVKADDSDNLFESKQPENQSKRRRYNRRDMRAES